MTGFLRRDAIDNAVVGRARSLAFALISLLCVVPIFAHGCHRGDHDDEPLFQPVEYRMMERELADNAIGGTQSVAE